MSRTVFPCHAAADRATAASIASFLEAGADVRVLLEEGQMQPGEDLARKAREGRMADMVLVLFSRHSLPTPWPRSKWEGPMQTEPAEENVRLGFVKCDDCSPPRVLTPLFDLAGLALPDLRRLKRWVRAGSYGEPAVLHPDLAADVEALGKAIADRSGISTVGRALLATEFRRMFREDFDQMLHLECGGRSLAALAGDLGSQLGLRIEGDLESNLESLRAYCSARRLLLWLDGASEDEAAAFSMAGRSSTLISTEARPELPPDAGSLRAIQFALRHPAEPVDWDNFCRLSRQGVRIAAEQGRMAECFEFLQQWHSLAKTLEDRPVLEESACEIVWILEGWNRFAEARRWEFDRATRYDDQMSLEIEFSSPPASRLVRPAEAPAEKPPRVPLPRPEQFSLF